MQTCHEFLTPQTEFLFLFKSPKKTKNVLKNYCSAILFINLICSMSKNGSHTRMYICTKYIHIFARSQFKWGICMLCIQFSDTRFVNLMKSLNSNQLQPKSVTIQSFGREEQERVKLSLTWFIFQDTFVDFLTLALANHYPSFQYIR